MSTFKRVKTEKSQNCCAVGKKHFVVATRNDDNCIPPHKFSCFNLGPWETLNDKYKATVIPRQPQLLLFFLTLAGPGLTHPWTLAGHLAFHTSMNCFSYVEVFLFNPSLPYYTCASTSVSVGNTFCDVDSDPSSYYKLLR